jgi:hypothetical protein
MFQIGRAMSHPLDGCWAKIERANHNINRLHQLTTSFLHLHGHDYRTDINADSTEHIYRVFGPPHPPIEFAVRAGEIINHLRSSLDHLVWQLVLRKHSSPSFKVQFPICVTVTKYKEAIRGGIINGIARSAQTIIQGAQPYHRAIPADDPLAILHELNNIDKHKLLLVVSSETSIEDKIHFYGDRIQPGEETIIPKIWSRRTIRAQEGGAELFRVRFPRPLKVSMYTELTPQIAFERFGVRENEAVIPGPTSLRDAVIKTIKLFDGEF